MSGQLSLQPLRDGDYCSHVDYSTPLKKGCQNSENRLLHKGINLTEIRRYLSIQKKFPKKSESEKVISEIY